MVLIDEYDRPLNKAKSTTIRSELIDLYQPFFKVIKSMSNDIRLAYVTGIKSYGSANTFDDITYDPDFMTLYGSTEEEVYNMAVHYSPYTLLLSTEVDELKQCYGGYSWDLTDASDHRNTTFNSYLIQKYFSSGRRKQPYSINSSSQSIY